MITQKGGKYCDAKKGQLHTYLFGCKIVQFECSKIAKQCNLYHVNLQNNAVCEKCCRSIAFCCISTGEFRFPNRRAAEIAVETCKDARIQVVFNVFKDIDYDIYSELLADK